MLFEDSIYILGKCTQIASEICLNLRFEIGVKDMKSVYYHSHTPLQIHIYILSQPAA